MTVAKLIERLKTMEQDLLVVLYDEEEYKRKQRLAEKTEKFNNADKITLTEYLKINPLLCAECHHNFHKNNNACKGWE